MTRSWTSRVLFFVMSLLVLVGCGSSDVFSVELDEFSITPKVFSVRVGDEVTFRVVNVGVIGHNITVFGVDDQKLVDIDVEAGGSTSFKFSSSTAGEFLIICSVPGHEMAGMTAKIVVGP